MAETPRLDLPYLAASQYQKEIFHNISLDRLDLLCQCAVLDRNLTAPPASPALGDAYIIGPSATDAWAGHDHELALWVSSQWELIAPLPGFQCWVIDEAVLVYWSGTAWTIVTGAGGGATTFLGLTDTPATYSGQAGKTLLVNPGETALEFGTTAGSAPVEAPYVVTAPHALLSAERVVTDNTEIQWDSATAGQLKATIAPQGVTLEKLVHQAPSTLLGRGDTLLPVDAVQVLTVGPGLLVEGTTLRATGGGATTFVALTDTPDTYSGQAGNVVAVNSGATGLEFVPGGGGVGTGTTLGVEVQRAATQSIPNAVNTAVSWDTEIRDDAALFDPGQPTRLTAPTAGWYTLSCSVQWDSNTTQTRIVNARLNGTQYLAVDQIAPAGIDQRQALAFHWYLSAGDYWEIILFQGTTAARTCTAVASLVALSAAVAPGTFLALTDTPDSYLGQAGNLVRVNAGATATEFVAAALAAASGTPLSVARYAASGTAVEPAPNVVVDGSNRLGVGTTTPTVALDVVGQIKASDGAGTRTNLGLGAADEVPHGRLGLGRATSTAARLVFHTELAQKILLFGDANSARFGLSMAAGAMQVHSASSGRVDIGAIQNADGTTFTPWLTVVGSTGVVGVGTRAEASLGSGATYQALTVNGSTLYVGPSSVQERPMARLLSSWGTSTDATRTARLTVSAYDATAAREGLRVEADGTAARLGFLGAPAVLRQTVPAAATDPATTMALANSLRTALVNLGLCG